MTFHLLNKLHRQSRQRIIIINCASRRSVNSCNRGTQIAMSNLSGGRPSEWSVRVVFLVLLEAWPVLTDQLTSLLVSTLGVTDDACRPCATAYPLPIDNTFIAEGPSGTADTDQPVINEDAVHYVIAARTWHDAQQSSGPCWPDAWPPTHVATPSKLISDDLETTGYWPT